jgi:hypothetical protein
MRSGVGVFVLSALAYVFLESAKKAYPVTNELFFTGSARCACGWRSARFSGESTPHDPCARSSRY